MKVTLTLDPMKYKDKNAYAVTVQFETIDRGIKLLVRRPNIRKIIFNDENLVDNLHEHIKFFQDVVRFDKISQLDYGDKPFVKRIKKVFYAVIDEFISPNYEFILIKRQ
jgi:hypothetical protein